MVDLMGVRRGWTTPGKKYRPRGITTFGFAMGSKRMNAFLDHNPQCESRRFMYSTTRT